MANKQIHWAHSDSHRKLKESVVSSANQISPVKHLEHQLHSASLPNNQLWEEDLQRLDRAQDRHLDLVLSNPRHKEVCSADSQHSESLREQVFLEHPPRKFASPHPSAYSHSRSRQASARLGSKIRLSQPQHKMLLAYPNSLRYSPSPNSSIARLGLAARKFLVAIPDLFSSQF